MSAEIIVIDNNSSDGSQQYFENRFSEVCFIWNQENLGYSKANNLALKKAIGEYVLFLNPDTIVGEDTFSSAISFFQTNTNAGAVGVKMIDGAGNFLPESKRGLPGIKNAFCKLTGLHHLFPTSSFFSGYYVGHLPKDINNIVPVLSGAFMMIRKKILDEIGGFDERFFMYGEDIDLSYRIIQSGYVNYYLAATTIIHFKGESTAKQSKKYVTHFFGAMLLFIQKYHRSISYYVEYAIIKIFILVKVLSINCKNLFTKEKRIPKVDNLSNHFALMGSLDKCAALKSILINNGFQDVKCVNDLNSFKEKEQQVIFILGNLSYKKMIADMEINQNTYSFFIHAENSLSIVGSNNKNSGGLAIPLVLP